MSLHSDLQIVEIEGVDVMTWRLFQADKGTRYRGGKHYIGHATLLLCGGFAVFVNGVSIGTFQAPATVFIPPDDEHDFLVTEDGTKWLCAFLPTSGVEGELRALSMEA